MRMTIRQTVCFENKREISKAPVPLSRVGRRIATSYELATSRRELVICRRLSYTTPHIAITRSLSQSIYENFKLLKNIATTCRLKWKERKSYRSRSALVDCRTDLVLMSWLLVRSRRLAKHGDIARVVYELLRYNMILKPSSDELLPEAYKLLRYDTVLKRRSDEFTRIFPRVSAITV